jgi:hypothetical protein
MGGGGVRYYISDFEGSQVMPTRPSCRGTEYDRNWCLYKAGRAAFSCDFNIGTATLGRHFGVTNGKAASEECRAKWNLGTNSAFALGSRIFDKKFLCDSYVPHT